RNLSLAEPGDLDRRREIVGGVLDRMMELVSRDVDRQADAVVGELLDLRRHRVTLAAGSRAAFHLGRIDEGAYATRWTRARRATPSDLDAFAVGRCGREGSNLQGPKSTGT